MNGRTMALCDNQSKTHAGQGSCEEELSRLNKELEKEVMNYKTWIKIICLIIAGLFFYFIYKDILEGNLSYSVLEIAGYFAIGAVFIALIYIAYKKLSPGNPSIKKAGWVLMAVGMLPIALFVGLVYLNRAIVTPVIHLGNIGILVIGLMAASCVIGMSLWAKTPILILAAALFVLPDYLLSLKYETLLIIGPLVALTGIAICLWISYQIENI
jgi:hypothetical protein